MRAIQTIPYQFLPETLLPVPICSPAHATIPFHRIVAHEIRQYLNILTEGIADLRARATIEAYHSIESLEHASNQIDQLIPLLQISQTEGSNAPVDLTTILWEQLDLLEPLFHARSVKWTADIPNDPIIVSGDRHQLTRALLNLIKNAIEACAEHDTVSITCTLLHPHIVITIRDTGLGMTPEQLERLWQPLFTTKANGTGLGTSIAQHIIINHGGSIRAESTLGIGTTLSIELPLFNPLS